MRLDVLGLARALGAVPADASAGDVNSNGSNGRGNADDNNATAAASFASAWLQSGAVLALHPSR